MLLFHLHNNHLQDAGETISCLYYNTTSEQMYDHGHPGGLIISMILLKLLKKTSKMSTLPNSESTIRRVMISTLSKILVNDTNAARRIQAHVDDTTTTVLSVT